MKKLSYRSKTGPTVERSYRWLAIGLIATAVSALALTSCNVTRTVTTSSEVHKHGDTTVVIQTKTIERYDAQKNIY